MTHRAFMFGAIANEKSVVKKPLLSEDCLATLEILRQLGLEAEVGEETVSLSPPSEWRQPEGDLYCGNSGTTMRLMAGLLASRPLTTRLTGDASLSRRPMKRVGEPLRLMGAEFDGDTPPVEIRGSDALNGIEYHTPVPSAQIKSSVLLAGLRAQESTTVVESAISRDHTERMLEAIGVPMHRLTLPHEHRVTVEPHRQMPGFDFAVPADISSAAFFAVAAALVPGSRLRLLDVTSNPTRTGLFDVFEQCGVPVLFGEESVEMGEPRADVEISAVDFLHPFTIEGALVPRLIDEIPVLAVLATQCNGVSRIRNAAELRVKESDRLEIVATTLRAMGAKVETYDDGLDIEGGATLKSTVLNADGDHRIAMAFAVAGLIAEGETVIHGAESIATSYPGFEKNLWSVAVV